MAITSPFIRKKIMRPVRGFGTSQGASQPRLSIIGTKVGPLGGFSVSGVTGDASHKSTTVRFRVDMPPYDVYMKKALYWNGRIGSIAPGEVVNPNPLTNKVSWWPEGAGATIPLFGQNKTTRSILIGGGLVRAHIPATDLIVPGSSKPYIQQFVIITSGVWPVGRVAHQTVNGLSESDNYFAPNAGVDFVDTIAEWSTNSPSSQWGPSAILGIPVDGVRRPGLIIVGDSIGTTSGSDGVSPYGDVNGNAGWLERKVGAQYATSNASRSNSRLHWRAAGMNTELSLTAPYATDCALLLGLNDVSAGRTLAQMQADATTIVTSYQQHDVRVHLGTITPNPASTADGGVDGGNALKPEPFETTRLAYNAWVRTEPLGVASVIDTAITVEDPGRPGFWIPNAVPYSTDMIHPQLIAMTAMGDAFDLGLLT